MKWPNSTIYFVIVPKLYRTVCLGLDPARVKQAFKRPIHREPTLHDIFPKVPNAWYMTIIDAGAGYPNLKCDKNVFKYICMSVLQVQVQQNTFWSGAIRWHVPVKN